MKAPHPLPVAGDWIVTADGSQYEVVPHCTGHGAEPCSWGTGDADGVYFLSADDGEVIWSPWEHVRRLDRRPVAARFLLTITHTEAVPPSPAFLDALADVIRASMAAAGIPGGATIAVEPDRESIWPLGWSCPADDAEHWPKQAIVGIEPGTPVECGHCGYLQTWDGTRWQDARS